MSSLAPGILIAAPPIGDPNFERTVVLLASHDEDGAFGWVINGDPIMGFADLLEQAGVGTPEVPVHGVVSWGGPVSTEQVWLAYPEEERIVGIEGQFQVGAHIMATASREFLSRIARGAKVPRIRAFAGYSGWAPGQLEREIRSGGWLPGPLDFELTFRTPKRDVWQRAYQKLGTTPIAFTTRTVGSA